MPRLSALLVFALLPLTARAAPPLEKTELFSSMVSDCRDIDLATWKHPARTVLEKNTITVERVQLCNGGHYPIFHVQLPYDPQGQTKDFFLPLYEEMRKANGKWPYALVASNDAQVVYVSYPDSNSLALDYEFYAPAQ